MQTVHNIKIFKQFENFHLDIDFQTSARVTGILGASGAGKSLLLKTISGLLHPDLGKIEINNEILFDHEKKINVTAQKRKTGFLFQHYALFPHMTIQENIGFGVNDKKTKNEKVKDLLKIFHIEHLANEKPKKISGGQQQRCALARALAVEPSILLLDEPFSALDDHLKHKMINELSTILKKYNIFTLIVTHNIDEAYRLCDELVILKNGRVEIAGEKNIVFKNPVTVEAARLTGCKNIVPAIRCDAHHLVVPEWNQTFELEQHMETEQGFLGIRANHLRLARPTDTVNRLQVNVAGMSESMFRMTLYVTIPGSPPTEQGYDLQLELPKDALSGMPTVGEYIPLVLPMEHLLFLNA